MHSAHTGDRMGPLCPLADARSGSQLPPPCSLPDHSVCPAAPVDSTPAPVHQRGRGNPDCDSGARQPLSPHALGHALRRLHAFPALSSRPPAALHVQDPIAGCARCVQPPPGLAATATMGHPTKVVAASVCASRFFALAISFCRCSAGSRSTWRQQQQQRSPVAHAQGSHQRSSSAPGWRGALFGGPTAAVGGTTCACPNAGSVPPSGGQQAHLVAAQACMPGMLTGLNRVLWRGAGG